MIVKIKTWMDIPSVRFTCMSIIASGINFMTLIIWGRVFSPEDYGIATTFQALVSNIAIFVMPLQMMLCTTLADESEHKSIESIIRIFGFISIIELVCLVVIIERVMQYLYFTRLTEVILFICVVILNNIYFVLMGAVQGKQDFLLLGKIGLMLYFIKLIVSVLLGILGFRVLAVIVSFVIADIICIGLMLKTIMHLIRTPKRKQEGLIDRNILKQYIWLFVLHIMVSLYMNNGDLLLGNLYCSKEAIGLYSTAIGLSKISFFLIATPIATVALPKMTAAKGKRRYQNKVLILAEILTLAGSFLYGICFYILGGWLIPILYGESYKGAAEYILPCVIFSVVLGMFWVSYQYILAAEMTRKFAIVTAVTGIIVIAWILKLKIELSGIPIMMAVSMILTMIILVINMKCNTDRNKEESNCKN